MPGVLADRACLGRALAVAANVAGQLRDIPVVGERDAAIRALADMPAGVAHHGRREASAIEEENGLLAVGESFFDRLQQSGRADGFRPAGSRCFAQVEHSNHRHPTVIDTLRESQQSVFARAAIVPAFHRGRGAAENDCASFALRPQNGHIPGVVARRLLLLVGPFVFFIDNDDAEPFQRREDSASRADDDAGPSGMDLAPFVVAFAAREMAVEDGDLTLNLGEPGLESLNGLWRERDLRHQNQRRAAKIDRVADRLEIDLRLAASGHPEKKKRSVGERYRLLDCLNGETLLRVEHEVARGQKRFVGKRIASDLAGFDRQPAMALQRAKDRFGDTGSLCEFGHRPGTTGFLHSSERVGLTRRLTRKRFEVGGRQPRATISRN